jgi:hypothetical protein
MILTNLLAMETNINKIYHGLIATLDHPSAIVKCWAISGVCYLGRKWSSRKKKILHRLTKLESDSSIAVRHRAGAAIKVLINDRLPMPAGWIKNYLKG